MNQLGLFEKEELEECRIEPKTTVRLGPRHAEVSLAKRNKEALARLKEILAELEGKDILVSQYCDFWRYQGLRLSRLKIHWWSFGHPERPSVIVLYGNKGAEVRILYPRHLYHVRTQYYMSNKPYYLLDFWNGFWQDPIDKYHRHYDCLHIETV